MSFIHFSVVFNAKPAATVIENGHVKPKQPSGAAQEVSEFRYLLFFPATQEPKISRLYILYHFFFFCVYSICPLILLGSTTILTLLDYHNWLEKHPHGISGAKLSCHLRSPALKHRVFHRSCEQHSLRKCRKVPKSFAAVAGVCGLLSDNSIWP